jgi:hypothetical protein
MLVTCPACDGNGCDVCKQSGTLTEEEEGIYLAWAKWARQGPYDPDKLFVHLNTD